MAENAEGRDTFPKKSEDSSKEPEDAEREGESEAVALPSPSMPRDQYAEAVCECVCTCESCELCEETNGFGVMEDVTQMCVCAQEYHGGGDSLPHACFCTCGDDNNDLLPVEEGPLYALHCCGCGVQLSPVEVCSRDADERGQEGVPPNGHPEQENSRYNLEPNPIRIENNAVHLVSTNSHEGSHDDSNTPTPVPLPPPPPPLPPCLLGPSITRVTVTRSTPAPLTLLTDMSRGDDGQPVETRLHEAARIGDEEAVVRLLQDPDVKNTVNSRVKPLMATPLREAVVGGNPACVEALLRCGAEVDAVDVKGQTPLLVAASLSRPEVMELLLTAGADPEGSRYNSCTPLLLAVREGCELAVKTLLRHSADPQPVSLLTTCVPGWPLQHCAVYRHYDCFLTLLRGGADPSLCRVLRGAARGTERGAGEEREGAVPRIDPCSLQRLSITRTLLRHASDRPEFVRTYREFGGPLEVPEGDQDGDSPVHRALAAAREAPQSLLSLCRLALCRRAGAVRLPALAAEAGLPARLQAFLAYQDLETPACSSCDKTRLP